MLRFGRHTMRRKPATLGHAVRSLVWAMSVSAVALAARTAPTRPASVWTRLDLVENTAEGSGFDRCEIEETLQKGQKARWRVFYGEARADSGSGWSPIRSSSGCAQISSEATTWTLRGAPYFLVDVILEPTGVVTRDVLIEARCSVQRLTGFAEDGAPVYEARTEKRTLRVPEGDSAVVPILIASDKEIDGFRVRELLLKFRARAADPKPQAAYGEIAVTADVPRAEIFLDGGFAGRTSSDGPVVLSAVRPGEREIIVQDASGREARALGRIQKGRRTSL